MQKLKNYLKKILTHSRYSPRIMKYEIPQDLKTTSSLEKILILLRSKTGHDFSQYKKTTAYRRIERRMSIHQIDRIASYVRLLQENPNELNFLFKELLIGVTSFFRDPQIWEELKNTECKKARLFIEKLRIFR